MDAAVENGQPLLALMPSEWQETFRSGQLLGRPISDIFRRSAMTALAYAVQYPELDVYVSDLDARFFFVQVLVHLHGYAQRVFLERVTCGTCSWSGMSAEPFSIDNYLGLHPEVRTSLMTRAMTLPQIPCPHCGAKLPRRSVWTEH
jgi:hypothetical protein